MIMNGNWFNTSGSDERTGRLVNHAFIGQTSIYEPSLITPVELPNDHTSLDIKIKKQLKREKFPRIDNRAISIGKMDRKILARAEEILYGFDIEDPIASRVDRESFCGVVLQLWEGANECSDFHQDILAILENGVLSTENFQPKHLSLFMEAIKDLKNDVLTQAHVEVINHRFIAEGLSPLALLSEIEEENGS
jgi:hypothetical protein